MSQQGWYTDLSSNMESDNNNSGFSQRNNAFRKNFKTNEIYRQEGQLLAAYIEKESIFIITDNYEISF